MSDHEAIVGAARRLVQAEAAVESAKAELDALVAPLIGATPAPRKPAANHPWRAKQKAAVEEGQAKKRNAKNIKPKDEAPVGKEPSARDKILSTLREAGVPLTTTEIINRSGASMASVYNGLSHFTQTGKLERVGTGTYQIAKASAA